MKKRPLSLAPAGIFSEGGGSEVPRGRAFKWGRRLGVPGAEPPEQNFKKAMKILQFFDNFNGKFAIFKVFKMLSNFSRKFWQKILKI